MSAAECQYQDWHAKGLIDGMQGKTSAQFLRYARACDKHGMQPNQQDYMSGRNEGLKHFCTRETGFDQGIGNNEYHGVCPVAIEQQFLSGYHIGREMFVARNRVQNIDSTITYNQIQIARLQKDVVSLEKKIIDSESEESTRQGNLDAIKRKTSRIGALRQQIYEMRGDRPEAVRQCQEVRSRVYQQGFSTSSQCD